VGCARDTAAGNSIRIDDLLGARISCGPHHLRCWPFIFIGRLFFSLFSFFLSLYHVDDDLSQMFTFGWRKEQNFLIKVLQQHNCFNPAGKYKVSQQTHNTQYGNGIFFLCLMSYSMVRRGVVMYSTSRKRKSSDMIQPASQPEGGRETLIPPSL
jgi:Ni,Fe-hydrogenase I cytochrome b subunit